MRRRALVATMFLAGCNATRANPEDGGVTDAAPDVQDVRVDPRDVAIEAECLAIDVRCSVTTIIVRYPVTAGSISLRGSGGPFSWTANTPMRSRGDGTWIYESTAITAPIEVKPVLGESMWARGANYHVFPNRTNTFDPRFVGSVGRLEVVETAFHSDVLDNERRIEAYLPPAYDENTAARFGVVYMQDGQNLFDDARAFGGVSWEVDDAVNALADDGRCPDMRACVNDGECGGAECARLSELIVVGISNVGSSRIDEYTPTRDATRAAGGRASEYIRMLVTELKPLIDSRLRTEPRRERTLIAGSSLGGLVSVYAGARRGDVFGYVAAFSPSTWWDERAILTMAASLDAPSPLAFYVDSGDSGPSNDDVSNTRDLADVIASQGYTRGEELLYVVGAGDAHNEEAWSRRFPNALAWLARSIGRH